MAEKIPTNMIPKYQEIAGILIPYCDQYLDEEYKELCLHALAKLARKRPSPLNNGRNATWAAGIVYAVGSANFIFDKTQKIHMTSAELAAPFGVSKSTVAQKGSQIRKMLKIDYFNSEWVLPSEMDSNFAVWMVEVNGFAVDARKLPVELQRVCYEKGLIPYVPADRKES